MKKTQILAIAALAAAATFQTAAKAEDPVSPVPGAVCRLYLLDVNKFEDFDAKTFVECGKSMPQLPAAATFVDTAGEFKDVDKREDTESDAAMWTGWLKQEKAGTYTFVCKRYSDETYRYSIWINGTKCVEAGRGQKSFNVDLNAGFNTVKIITWSSIYNESEPLSIKYKKESSLKEPEPFGPGDMFHDDEE